MSFALMYNRIAGNKIMRKQKKCKPVSRVLYLLVADSYHLSRPVLTEGLYQPTR